MKPFRGGLGVSLMLLALAGGGCATTRPPAAVTAPVTPVVAVGVAAPAVAWVRTELYFGIGDWTETALSTEAESRWATFLDAEVTPRFPDGLSVIDIYGQWRDKTKAGTQVKRERSRLLIIVHPSTAENSAKIDAIRDTWKRMAGEQSVLCVNQPVDVWF